MGKAKARRARSGNPFKTAFRLAGDVALIAHLATNADALKLTTLQRRTLVIAAKELVSEPYWDVIFWYRTGKFPPVAEMTDRALACGRKILLALAERGEDVPLAPALTIEIEKPLNESLAVHLATNADRLGLSDDHRARLTEAYRLWGEDKDHRARDRRNADRSAAAVIASEVQAELGAALGSDLALEALRGEEQVQRLTGGRTRVCGRDGLMLLFDSGALTGMTADAREDDKLKALEGWKRANVRMAAALAYREYLEHLAADLRSNIAAVGVGGSRASSVADKASASRAHAARIIDEIDRAVQVRIRSPKAIQALRLVAGEGRTVRSLAPGGKNVETMTRSLNKALDVAAHILRVPGHTVLTEVHE